MASFKPPYLRMCWKGSDIQLPRRAEHPLPVLPSLHALINHPGAWPHLPTGFSSQPHKHQDHTLAWSQGRPGVPTLYRAAACAFVRSAVRSSSGLPSFREGLGPKTCRDKGRPRFQGFLGTYHAQDHPLTPTPTPMSAQGAGQSWGGLSPWIPVPSSQGVFDSESHQGT